MIVDWLLFPAVMLAVCLGCGLLVERAAGWQLPGALVPSIGLAVVIVVGGLAVSSSAIAELGTPVVLVLALTGLFLSRGRLRVYVPQRSTVALGLALYAVFAAPMVLSGQASFLGYFLLNDAAVHFSMIDWLTHHGRDISSLPVSSYRFILNNYFTSSYPTGAQVGAGLLRPLVGQDIAWIFQPYLAVICTLSGLALVDLLRSYVRSHWLRLICAFTAAQAGLLFAYYLEASIKELATSWISVLTVALVERTLRTPLRVRGLLPLAAVSLAGLFVLNLAILPWVGFSLLAFMVLAVWRVRHRLQAIPRRRLALVGAGAAVVLAVLAVPLVGRVKTFVDITSAVLTRQGDLGNLATPLLHWQVLGIWPVTDFRFPVTTHYRVTYALLGIELAAGVLGLLWAVRRRAYAPLLLILGTAIAAAYLLSRASPYASAKVLMIASVPAVLAAMLGSVALHEGGRRLESFALSAVLLAGVLWTNETQYRGANVAPRDRLSELASIGSRFAGPGSTFYNLSDEYAYYFLRRESPIDPASGPPTPRAGLPARTPDQARMPWDPDDLAPGYIQGISRLVLGRSPSTSRPPSDFALAYRGRFYDVWRRRSTPTVLEHVPLGNPLAASSFASCHQVLAVAAQARADQAMVAAAIRPGPVTLVPTQAAHPPNWGAVAGDPYSLIPRQQAGAVSGSVRVPAGDRYAVWLNGSFGQTLHVLIDGREVGSVGGELGPPGQAIQVSTVLLSAGVHTLAVVRPDPGLGPGEDGLGREIGPLMLVPAADRQTVTEVPPAQARRLCGQPLDWLEVVRS